MFKRAANSKNKAIPAWSALKAMASFLSQKNEKRVQKVIIIFLFEQRRIMRDEIMLSDSLPEFSAFFLDRYRSPSVCHD